MEFCNALLMFIYYCYRNEFSDWKKPWKQLTLREFVIHLLMALFGFGSSNFDTWSDGALGYSYVDGATYQYHFSNMSDPELLKVA